MIEQQLGLRERQRRWADAAARRDGAPRNDGTRGADSRPAGFLIDDAGNDSIGALSPTIAETVAARPFETAVYRDLSPARPRRGESRGRCWVCRHTSAFESGGHAARADGAGRTAGVLSPRSRAGCPRGWPSRAWPIVSGGHSCASGTGSGGLISTRAGVDGRRLAGVIASPGEARPFKQKTDSPFPATAVTLLIRYSRSMRGRPILLVQPSRSRFGSGPRTLRRRCEVLGFTNPGLGRRPSGAEVDGGTASPPIRPL